jgi:hypothetical protein
MFHWKVNDMVTLVAASCNGRREEVNLSIDGPDAASIELSRADGVVTTHTGSDLFECLQSIRRSLESDGLLLCCQGARSLVFPSGMSRQMSNGRLAYPLQRDPPLSDADLVDIFLPAELSEVATVDEQLEAVREFFGFQGR